MVDLDKDGIPNGEIESLQWAEDFLRDPLDPIERPPGVSDNLWGQYLVAFVIKLRKSRHKKDDDVPAMTTNQRTHLFAVSIQ